MTLKYLDSRRLTGLSTDALPELGEAFTTFTPTNTGVRKWASSVGDFCNESITSSVTMGTTANLDTDYAVASITKNSSGNGCNAWSYNGVANATKGATNTDFSVSSTTAFTTAGWFYLDSVGVAHTLFGFFGALTNTHWTAARITAGNKLQAWSANNGVSDITTIITANSVSVSTWHHFAFIHNGTAHTIYLDGSIANKGTGTGNGGSASNGNWTIAGGWGDGVTVPTAPFLVGRLQKITMWNIALTEANITTIYNSGSPIIPTVSLNNIKGYWNFAQTSGGAINRAV